MQMANFVVGESRYIRLLVKALNGQPFLIVEARYDLIKNGVVESFGACTIDDHIIMALISPATTGTYKLKITYQIGDELLIEIIEVVVR